MAKAKIITGLDIGSSSLKALMATKGPEEENLEVLGQIEVPSFGVRRGVVVNVERVAKDIEEILSQLQNETGQKINEVYVNLGGSHIFSLPSHGTVVVSRADQKISKEDINRVIQAAQTFSLPSNKEILEVFPKEFIVDNQRQIKEPLDMEGIRLEVEVLALCAFSPYIKNLISSVLNAGFRISDIVPSPLASAAAVLSPQQKELGVCLIDIGGGTTSFALYQEGDLIHLAVFPIGSGHITSDLAVGLRTDINIAEQIKKEFGRCIFKGGKRKEKIELPQNSGETEPLVFSHKMLVDIIEARVSEIFDLVQKEIKKVSPQGWLPAGLVLTGGGAKLPKIVEFAKKELKLPAKIGWPRDWKGLEKDPAWSGVCGLILEGMKDLEMGRMISVNWEPFWGERVKAKLKKIFKIFIP